jgi:hypothetical protein
MSSIITNTILTNYPIAGVDNDSQGFRDNFLRIKTALDQAKIELQLFENRAVLKSTLDSNEDPVENDINGSSIVNGNFNKLYGTSYTGSIASNVATVNLDSGISQQLTLTINSDTTLAFVNWPATGQYASVRVHLTTVPTIAAGVDVTVFTTQNNGYVIKDISFPTTLHVSKESYVVLEAWSNDHGVTVFMRYLGKYVKP